MNEGVPVSSIFNCEGVASNRINPLAGKPVVAILTIDQNSRSVGCPILGKNGNCQAVPLIDQRTCPYLHPMESRLSTQVQVVPIQERKSTVLLNPPIFSETPIVSQVVSAQDQEEPIVVHKNVSAEVPVESSATVQL